MRFSVLYIDDDAAIARLVQRYMGRLGHEVAHSETEDDALALLRARPFDVVVLDHYLRQTTGHDVLARMREAAIDVPVVYVTGSNEAQVAIEAIKAQGWGMLLYLRQEGRGIGLVNKLRAYAMQDQGFDTVDANVRLGFAIDARDFSVAARMLDLLNVGTVRLLTNNPNKVVGLEAAGIKVAERLPIILPANPHNERYLATKRDRTGHQL